MWQRESHRVLASVSRIAFVAMTAIAMHGAHAESAFRFNAPITVQGTGSFIDLALPPSIYGRSQQDGLRDVRVVDSKGERVPFALPAPRSQVAATEELRDVVLYPLPARPAADGVWDSPVDVVVQGDTVRVTKRGGARMGGASGADAAHASAGWLFDLGERAAKALPPSSLQLRWSGPIEFNASYRLETSADLRNWRPADGGQLMALTSPSGALTQPMVVLPEIGDRFVRLVWLDAATAPVVTGARARVAQSTSVALDAPSALSFAASPEPVGKIASDASTAHALHFDLGGALPLQQIDLQLATGSRIVPARVQGRDRIDVPWRDLGGAVFYRLEHAGSVSRSPPWPVQANVRYIRIVIDERAGLPDPKTATLKVTAQLAHVVFVAQGQAPYTLLTGSGDANDGALPITTLVPDIEAERPRFAHATLGDWREEAAVVQRAAAEQRSAERRPWFLWAVLLVGVLLLGGMVWRLARPQDAKPGA